MDETQQQHGRQAICILQALWMGWVHRTGQYHQVCRGLPKRRVSWVGVEGWDTQCKGKDLVLYLGFQNVMVPCWRGHLGKTGPFFGELEGDMVLP